MTTHCEFKEKLSSSGQRPTDLVLGPRQRQLAPPPAHDDEHGPLSSQWEQVAGQRQVLEVVHPASPLLVAEGRE